MSSWGIRWRNLRAFILTWFFVPTVIALAVVAWVTYISYERAAEERAVERHRELVAISAVRLREELTKFTDVLAALARSEEIHQNDLARQRAALWQARRRLAIFDGGVVLLDNFGRVVAAEPERPEILGKDWSNRSYFRYMLGSPGVIFSDAVTDGPQGAEVVALVVPITGSSGEFLGTLAGMFRLGSPTVSAFYASIVRLRIGEGGHTYVMDGQGQVIYYSDLEHIGEDFSAQAAVAQVLKGETDAIRTFGHDGRDIVAAFAPVPGTSWGLVTEEDWAVLTSSSRGYGQFLLLLLGLGMILPAVGVALFARQRHVEVLERERLEQELGVARLIQQTLLPHELPSLPGWEVAVHWQPATAVGGDFYDFLPLPDGRLYLTVADVSGKGVPAALIMATTRAALRGSARRMLSPGMALQRTNDLLYPEILPDMFVTCLYAILDPSSGRLQYANAGHNLPYRRYSEGVVELRATGLPLGLIPGISYAEYETTIESGESLLLYSDGLTEAHNLQGEMFDFARLRALVGEHNGTCSMLIERLLAELAWFTGPNWEQEDDVTLVTLKRLTETSILAPRPTEKDETSPPPATLLSLRHD